MRFEDLPVSPQLKKAAADMGFVDATPIQAKTIDIILKGRDVIGQARTGSGKTAAFAIPCIEKTDAEDDSLQALILAPTRELAMQISEQIRRLLKYTDGIKVLAVYGGQPITEQIKALKKGVNIVVGTPGRVIDHIKRHTLKMKNVSYVVLDEADEMLNMGFREDIEKILKKLPEQRQTLLFSATMPKAIIEIVNEYQNDPEHIAVETEKTAMPDISQTYVELKEKTKPEALRRMLEYYEPGLAIVFCNTKKRVDAVTENLKAMGFAAEGLHGDMEQPKRDKVMKKFRSCRLNILVATDVAARGIDVENVELVINYDLPQESEFYVHRVGRTGRAGKSGAAVSFAAGKEKERLKAIVGLIKKKIKPMPLPSYDDIFNKKIDRLVQSAQNEAKQDIEKYVAIVEKIGKNTMSPVLLAAGLLKNFVKQSDTDDIPDIENGPETRLIYIDAGSRDGVRIKDVVGALAGECGIQGSVIGDIQVETDHTLAEVPKKYIKDILKGMKGKKIKTKAVCVSLVKEI